jgi:hypothetical protein
MAKRMLVGKGVATVSLGGKSVIAKLQADHGWSGHEVMSSRAFPTSSPGTAVTLCNGLCQVD